MGMLTKPQMEELIIESLADHKNWTGMRDQYRIYQNWERLYWIVNRMSKVDDAIQLEAREKVRNRMVLGIPLIVLNAAFIVYGTFFKWSWDIVEPITYFIASGTTLALASVFFLKWRRPFSYEESLSFISKGFLPDLDRARGFNRELFEEKKLELKKAEHEMREYFYMRV